MFIPVLPRFQCVFQVFFHILSSYTSDHTFPTACCWGVEHATECQCWVGVRWRYFHECQAGQTSRGEEYHSGFGGVGWSRMAYWPQFAVRAAESTQRPAPEPSPCKEILNPTSSNIRNLRSEKESPTWITLVFNMSILHFNFALTFWNRSSTPSIFDAFSGEV